MQREIRFTQKVKDKWIKELLNPDRRQTRATLRREDEEAPLGYSQCCLGVLCEVLELTYDPKQGYLWFNDTWDGETEMIGYSAMPPHITGFEGDWHDNNFSDWNDDLDMTFVQIAAKICDMPVVDEEAEE